MVKKARETCAPAVNEDGPHVIVDEKGVPRVAGKCYKFKDPVCPGDFLRLPNGKVIVKRCCAHNGGNKLYCPHRKELSKCRWCKGGGTSNCPHNVRRELCPTCKGTSAGISQPAMARKAKAGESSSAAPAAVPAPAPAAPLAPAPAPAPELAPPNQLRLCDFSNRIWIPLADFFTKQGPETEIVALKRKADDLQQENKRLKTDNTQLTAALRGIQADAEKVLGA
tara:strand:+ start:312 stop:983 length:672 start_codon:yes stop_codon:yes gene_type:complete